MRVYVKVPIEVSRDGKYCMASCPYGGRESECYLFKAAEEKPRHLLPMDRPKRRRTQTCLKAEVKK